MDVQALGNERKGSSIHCPTADTGRHFPRRAAQHLASQRSCRAAILLSLRIGATQTHWWPSLILVMTAVQQAGGQTGGPSESSSHKIPDTEFLGHKGICNYTALKLQGK